MSDFKILWRDTTTELDLTTTAPQGTGWTIEVSADGTSWGSPTVRTSLQRALLADGDLVQWDSNGNRIIPVQVRLKATDSKVLAQAEAALDRLLYKRTELEMTPPDAAGIPTVWDVETTERAQVFDGGWDLEELRYVRRLSFEMTCLPHGHSKYKRTAVAPAAVPNPVVLNNGSTLTGWTGSPNTPTIVSGRVRQTRTDSGEVNLRYATSAVATKYVVLDWYSPTGTYPTFGVNGKLMADTLRETIAGGVRRSWIPLPAGDSSLTSIRVAVIVPGASGGYLEVDQVQTATGLPSFGTTRQKALGVATPGSVRTQSDIEVVGTAALGFVLLHTGPATGAPPPLRPWLTSTAGVANPALISGAYNDLSAGANVYRIPVDAAARGEVEIVASLYTNIIASNVSVKCDVQGYIGGAVVGPVQSNTLVTNYPVAQNPYLLSLGRFQFPPTRLGSAGFVQITISQTSAGHIVYLDEAWNLSAGRGSALTVVEAQSQRRVRVEAPSQVNPEGYITTGTSADGSDARFPGVDFIRAWGDHQILPEGTAAFVAVTGALDPTVTTSAYDRYHTHAATLGTE
jgi:hypothetical protein